MLYRDRDFDPNGPLPSNAPLLVQDLELNVVIQCMGEGDPFLTQTAKQVLLSGLGHSPEVILYRQDVLEDCLKNETVVRELYDVVVEAIERKKRLWLGVFSRHPGGILHEAVQLLQMYTEILTDLRHLADQHADRFTSEGFATMFAMLRAELTDDYFAIVKTHLKALQFRHGVLMSAELGPGNSGVNYILRQPLPVRGNRFRRLLTRRMSAYTYCIRDRDEAGARILSEMRDHGINNVANAVAQAADHIRDFFLAMRVELAFYVACLNLHRRLAEKGVPICRPIPAASGSRAFECVDLRDVSLVLSTDSQVVGNEVNGNGKSLFVITGANQGGKSTFLRSVGLAQVMMQCGMYVAAKSFTAETCNGLFTHFKREEDATMVSGKLDEELKRMREIADALRPDAVVLFNETFASTNEREGSDIAGQVVRALIEARVRVVYVTHMYEFANAPMNGATDSVLFLRAEREEDGARTYKLRVGEPLKTGFGMDVFKEVFGGEEAFTQQGRKSSA